MNNNFFDEIIEIANNNKSSLIKGKNVNSKIIAHGINFDSKEELDVYEWLLEAQANQFINNIIYQPPSFELFKGLKNEKGKLIVRPHLYTADFNFIITDKWREFQSKNKIKIFNKLIPEDGSVYIDVKGSFNKYGGDRNFAVNSKWVLEKFGIYIWKIEPKDLFFKTWLPQQCIFTKKTKKLSKKYIKLKTFEHSNFIV